MTSKKEMIKLVGIVIPKRLKFKKLIGIITKSMKNNNTHKAAKSIIIKIMIPRI